MDAPRSWRDRRSQPLAAAATAVLAVAGLLVLVLGRGHAGPPEPPRTTVTAQRAAAPPAPGPPKSTGSATPTGSATRAADPDLGPVLPWSRPVSLTIPSIGVHVRQVVTLGYTADGSLEVPTSYDVPGWFAPGPSPGQLGPAVLAGHVDSTAGPGVFYRLGALRAGARVSVGRQDGTTAVFVVDEVARYPKAHFPTARVYGVATARAELRLITCGGDFDRSTGHYVDNVVAYAHLVSG